MRQNVFVVCEAVFFHLPILKHDCNFLDRGKKSGTTQPLCATPPGSKWSILHGRLAVKPAGKQWSSVDQDQLRLLRVTNVHEKWTSIRRCPTVKHKDERERIQRQEFVLLHPGQFSLIMAGDPHYCKLSLDLITSLGKNIPADITTSVFSFDDCFFTHQQHSAFQKL